MGLIINSQLASKVVLPFLPEASFGLWLLSLPASVRPLWILAQTSMSQLTVQQSYLLCWELLPDRNRKSMGLWYWELMSHPDPVVLPVGTLHSLEWFWVSRRIFVYSHHNTIVFFSKTSVTKFVRTMTHHPFKLGSPNWDQRCKPRWLMYPLLWWGNRPWPSGSNLTSKSKFTPLSLSVP